MELLLSIRCLSFKAVWLLKIRRDEFTTAQVKTKPFLNRSAKAAVYCAEGKTKEKGGEKENHNGVFATANAVQLALSSF